MSPHLVVITSNFLFAHLSDFAAVAVSHLLPSVVPRKPGEVSNTNVHISALNCYNRLLRKFTGHYC